MFEVVLFSMVLQCATVIEWNGNFIGPQVFSVSFYLAVYFLDFIKKGKIRCVKYGIKYTVLAFFMVFITTIVISSKRYEHFYEANWKLYAIQIVLYALYVIALFDIKDITKEQLHKMLIHIIVFVAFIGILQILTTVNILPKNIILKTFIYTDLNCAYYVSYYPRLFSTFLEPSYCAAFLVGAFFYIIQFGKNTRMNIILSLVLLCEIILTFSSTAYGTLAIVGVVYLLFTKKKEALKYLIPIGIVAVIFLAGTGELQDILNKVIFQKHLTGSYATRDSHDKRAIRAFLQSPILGVGLQNVLGMGSRMYLSMLGQLGILGCGCFIGFTMPFIIYFCNNRKSDYCMAAGMLLVTVLVAMMISIPYIMYTVFWLVLDICAVTVSIRKRELYLKDN